MGDLNYGKMKVPALLAYVTFICTGLLNWVCV